MVQLFLIALMLFVPLSGDLIRPEHTFAEAAARIAVYAACAAIFGYVTGRLAKRAAENRLRLFPHEVIGAHRAAGATIRRSREWGRSTNRWELFWHEIGGGGFSRSRSMRFSSNIVLGPMPLGSGIEIAPWTRIEPEGSSVVSIHGREFPEAMVIGKERFSFHRISNVLLGIDPSKHRTHEDEPENIWECLAIWEIFHDGAIYRRQGWNPEEESAKG